MKATDEWGGMKTHLTEYPVCLLEAIDEKAATMDLDGIERIGRRNGRRRLQWRTGNGKCRRRRTTLGRGSVSDGPRREYHPAIRRGPAGPVGGPGERGGGRSGGHG